MINNFFDNLNILNIFSRIVLFGTNIVIFEKFLESKIINIKIQTIGKKKIKNKFLEIIYKEFSYLPFVMIFYNIIVLTFIYILYFCFFILFNGKNISSNTQNNFGNQNKCNSYLFNSKILIEMFIITFLSFIINLIILIVIYYILVILSKEKVSTINSKNNSEINDGFIDKFYSYYRFAYYSTTIFLFLFLQDKENKKI